MDDVQIRGIDLPGLCRKDHGNLRRRLTAILKERSDVDDVFQEAYVRLIGYAGATGAYRLLVTSTALQFQATDGPAVLTVEPTMSTDAANPPVIHSSPLVIRVDLSADSA